MSKSFLLILKQYKEKFYKKYPKSKLKILEILPNNKILIENEFGICAVDRKNLFKNNNCSIQSAINKTEYFINQARKKYGDRYNYDLVIYKNSNVKIKIICKEHGVFEQKPYGHLLGKNCQFCTQKRERLGARVPSLNFIKKVEKLYPNKFNFNKTKYITKNTKVTLTCLIHGDFISLPGTILRGRGGGCKLCANKIISNYQKNHPNGWNKINWYYKAVNSKKFKSFKVYIIKCKSKTEEFYKIGRTYQTIKQRFRHIKKLYEYEIIKLYEFKELTQENANKAFDLENELKKQNREHKYTPKLKFDGMYECFKNYKI
jgi:hypothetical protein